MRGRSSGRSGLAVATVLTLVALEARALAQTSPGSATGLVGGASTCPSAEAVWDQIGTLVPIEGVTTRLRRIEEPRPPAQLFDLGGAFRVTVGRRSRDYADEARDCANRARFAAIFIALVVGADDAVITPLPSLPPTPATPVAATAGATDMPYRRPGGRVDLGATGVTGINGGGAAFLPGGDLRLSAGRRRLAFAFGVELLPPADTTVGGVSVRQAVLGLDLGVRVSLGEHRRLRPYAELAAAAELLTERAVDLASSQSGSSYAFGGRAAAGVVLATHARFAPFGMLAARWFPAPPSVFALPYGVVGRTPTLWLGATLGVSVGLL
jgi:hypothetical protein